MAWSRHCDAGAARPPAHPPAARKAVSHLSAGSAQLGGVKGRAHVRGLGLVTSADACRAARRRRVARQQQDRGGGHDERCPHASGNEVRQGLQRTGRAGGAACELHAWGQRRSHIRRSRALAPTVGGGGAARQKPPPAELTSSPTLPGGAGGGADGARGRVRAGRVGCTPCGGRGAQRRRRQRTGCRLPAGDCASGTPG